MCGLPYGHGIIFPFGNDNFSLFTRFILHTILVLLLVIGAGCGFVIRYGVITKQSPTTARWIHPLPVLPFDTTHFDTACNECFFLNLLNGRWGLDRGRRCRIFRGANHWLFIVITVGRNTATTIHRHIGIVGQ